MLRWTIQVIFSIFREVIGIDDAFWREALDLENIEYCTKYDLKIHLKGKKRGQNKMEEIDIMQDTIDKQEPSKYVKPKMDIHEEYTNLTCSAR